MSHHSEYPGLDPEAAREAFERQEKIKQGFKEILKESVGPTGLFPDGKIADHDEGEIAFAIGVNQGKVVVEFGKEISSLGMTPHQAMAFAQALIQKARSANIIGASKEPLTIEI